MDNKITKNKQGFTLMEVLVYMFITSILLIIVGSTVFSVINVRKHLNASNLVHSDARFIMNYLANGIHNVDLIDDVSPEPEQLHFYQLPDYRFSIELDGEDLVYREAWDTGSGFPAQSSTPAIALNSQEVSVTNLNIVAYEDNEGNANGGVKIGFTLTTGIPGSDYGYIQETFSTFLSLR